MKIFLSVLLSCLWTAGFAGEWIESYRTARTMAIRQNKKLLIFFSGSDWCTAGRTLERDLFKTDAFQRLARGKYILYNADFPKYSSPGQEAEERNKRLSARYGVHRFPAVIVIDPKSGGLLVRQIGMKDATPKKMLEKLSEIEAETAYRIQEKRSSHGKPEK